MRQTLLRIPPAPRTVLVSDRLHLNVLKLRLGVGNADRGDIGLAGLYLTFAPRDRCRPGSPGAMRSTMSLVAVWEAGADSHQPSTAQAVA